MGDSKTAIEVMAKEAAEVMRRRAQTEVGKAEDDMRFFGSGWLRINQDGVVERVDPRSVMLVDPNPVICECGMSGRCMMDDCKWPDAMKARIESMEPSDSP